jgi:hypothetical protein
VISKKHFVNLLKELGYVFKEQLHYQERYRRKGGTHIIHVPRRDKLDVLYVVSTLRQAGCTKSRIDSFIRDASA